MRLDMPQSVSNTYDRYFKWNEMNAQVTLYLFHHMYLFFLQMEFVVSMLCTAMYILERGSHLSVINC